MSGLITPYRPMTLEAAAGKNPVSHVGKTYNLAAGRIARALVGPNAGEVARTRRAAAEAALLRPGVTNPYSREPHPGSGEESSLNARQRGRNVLLAFWPYGKTIANSRFPLG